MRKHNPENERVKREYLRWLKNAHGRSEATLDVAAAAIDGFEAHAGFRPFKSFRREQAISFKEHLAAQVNSATGKPLAKATLYSRLKALQAFFEWLSREPGYRSHVHISDAAYFRPTDNDARVATARREKAAPSLAQVQHVIASMPTDTVVERRDRAVIALILLTGARDGAVASLRMKHLDMAAGELKQDARDVKTKRRKTFATWFFPVGDAPLAALRTWVAELTDRMLFGPDDPLFPRTAVATDESGLFTPGGVERRFWASADPIREIFRKAFAGAGLPYYGPHSLRRTLVALAYELKLGPLEMKTWSQNLRFRLVDALARTVSRFRDERQTAAFETCLFGNALRFRTSSDHAVCFAPDTYWVDGRHRYTGRHRFTKHINPDQVGDLNGEEEQCALAIDLNRKVKRWVRNLERRPDSFADRVRPMVEMLPGLRRPSAARPVMKAL